MLNTVTLSKQSNTRGLAMLLGGFDGLHVGHRLLVARAQESGLPIGVMTIVGGKDQALFTLREREEIFKNEGIDCVFELPFEEIKSLSPRQFLTLLEKEFSPRLFLCGDDFRFGYQAQGTPETLKTNTHVCVEVVELLKIRGEKISSSVIKQLLGAGDIEQANLFLGEDFFLTGEVKRDRQVGKTLGFPTANIVYPNEKFPIKKGVYQTWTEIDGKLYHGVTNFGARPTFDNDEVVTETHLIGFDGDLYGKRLTVHFTRYLRDIQKFDTIEDLKAQLAQDIMGVKNEYTED